MNQLDLSKMDFQLNQPSDHGKDYINALLCEMTDCVSNKEELEYFEYCAEKIEAEYSYVLSRLANSENQRFLYRR